MGRLQQEALVLSWPNGKEDAKSWEGGLAGFSTSEDRIIEAATKQRRSYLVP